MSKNYETVFILTSVLSEQQAKDTVEKFKGVLSAAGAEFVNEEQWGLRKLAYPIAHKTNGYYTLLEFSAPPAAILVLDTEYRRDERVIRYLTTVLDKHSLAYNEKRRSGAFKKKDAPAATTSSPTNS